MSGDIPLRNLHEVPAPPWWPPAPGWWWLVGGMVVAAVATWAWRRHRRRRREAIAAVFDAALAQAGSPQARLAALSALLRRAGRRRHAEADRLDGEAWLALVDLGPDGPLLLEGPYRPQVSATAVDALETRARERFLQWMQAP